MSEYIYNDNQNIRSKYKVEKSIQRTKDLSDGWQVLITNNLTALGKSKVRAG